MITIVETKSIIKYFNLILMLALYFDYGVSGTAFPPMDSKIHVFAFFGEDAILFGDRRFRSISSTESR